MLERRSAVAAIMKERGDLLAVAGLGSATYDLFAAGDHDLNFYDWGAMGSACTVGLGLALAQPDRPVVVLTGDGEILMGVGGLATIAQHQPRNLSILVLDNEQYAETGEQRTATGHGTDLVAVARGFGLKHAETLTDAGELEQLRTRIHDKTGPCFAVLKIEAGDVPRTIPLRDGAAIKHRFRQALFGKDVAV